MKIQKMIIPAGGYYIGDPGLILPENIWSKFYSDSRLVLQHEEHKFICLSLGGDGIWIDSDHYRYAIDTGSIAIIPEELIQDNSELVANENVRRKTFAKPALFRYLPDEFMSVGSIFFDLGEGEDLDYEYEAEVEGRSYWNEWSED